jgi:hypothetical protein
MDEKGCGRKWSWNNFGTIPCLQGMKKTERNFTQDSHCFNCGSNEASLE